MDNKSQLSQANTQNNLSKRQSRRSDQDKKMSTIRNIYADSKGN